MSSASALLRAAPAWGVLAAFALGCGSNHPADAPAVSGVVNGAPFTHRVGYFNAPPPDGIQLTLVLADDAPSLCGGGVPQGSNALQLFAMLPKIGSAFAAGTTFYFGSATPVDTVSGEARFVSSGTSCTTSDGPGLDGTLTITSRSDSSLGGTLDLSTSRTPAASARGNFTVPVCPTFQNPLTCSK